MQIVGAHTVRMNTHIIESIKRIFKNLKNYCKHYRNTNKSKEYLKNFKEHEEGHGYPWPLNFFCGSRERKSHTCIYNLQKNKIR